jgi:hypothetical protein
VNSHKTKDGLKIEIIARIRTPGYFVYKAEITNTTDKKLKYDLTKLESKHGWNIGKKRDYSIDGIPILRKGQLDPGETVTGLIMFQPNERYSTAHEFVIDAEKFRAKKKYRRGEV